jgi:hypothetical protein
MKVSFRANGFQCDSLTSTAEHPLHSAGAVETQFKRRARR